MKKRERFIISVQLRGVFEFLFIRINREKQWIEVTSEVRWLLNKLTKHQGLSGQRFEVSTKYMPRAIKCTYEGRSASSYFLRYSHSAEALENLSLCDEEMCRVFGPKPPKHLYVRWYKP